MKVSGTDVRIKPSKTELDKDRDNMLKKAAEEIKKHPAASGKTVETCLQNERCVKVNGVVAFQQAARKSSEVGAYSAPFTDLVLP